MEDLFETFTAFDQYPFVLYMLGCCMLAMAMNSAHNNWLLGAVVNSYLIRESSFLLEFVGALLEHYAQVSDTPAAYNIPLSATLHLG
jgi:hypothetical protein